MNKQIKLFSVLSIAVVFGVGFFVVDSVSAQTNEQIIQQLQAQIEQLKAQIKVFQQQLSGAVPSEPKPVPIPIPSARCFAFSRTLYLGVSDANMGGEVTQLQKLLAEDPTVYPEGLVTGYYGRFTEKAVQRWQANHGLPSTGYFGPLSRERMVTACPTLALAPAPAPMPISNVSAVVILPNGGETWTKDTTQIIKWEDMIPIVLCVPDSYCPPPAPRYYDIQLISYYPPCTGDTCPRHVALPYQIAKEVAGFSYNWPVGKYVDGFYETGGVVPDGSYTVRICQAGTSVCDESDNYFKIVSGTTSWQFIDANSFTLSLPSGWKFNKLQGIDSYVGEFVGDGAQLSFDYGWYSNSLKEDNDPNHIVTYETIDGYRAKIVTPKVTGNGMTGVYFGDLGGPNRFNIYGQNLNASQQEVALKIFRSLKFKK